MFCEHCAFGVVGPKQVDMPKENGFCELNECVESFLRHFERLWNLSLFFFLIFYKQQFILS